MTLRRVVEARLLRLWGDLRGAFTLRRREKRVSTYALRLLVVALLVALPVKKLVSLGLVGAVLALFKTALALALVAAALAAGFAIAEIARRRRARARRREGGAREALA